ncbi:hypothetical protein C7B80_02915 [Cyanosarcina cf. burmensis CCALA 770]|nr:hypothetical protein C7B80_02915 [Cyanosarcina cf. burmensis CCALA 770]
MPIRFLIEKTSRTELRSRIMDFKMPLLMRVQYSEHFCPDAISCKFAPRGRFEKLMDVNHTPLPVVQGNN